MQHFIFTLNSSKTNHVTAVNLGLVCGKTKKMSCLPLALDLQDCSVKSMLNIAPLTRLDLLKLDKYWQNNSGKKLTAIKPVF